MLIKNFQADSMREAMKRVKQEFGTEAVILNSQVVEEKGRPGAPAKKRFEITAGRDVPTGSRMARTPQPKSSPTTLSGEDKRMISDVGLLIRRFEREIDYLVHSQKEIRALLKTPSEARPLCSFLELHDLEKDLIARLFETTESSQPDKNLNLENIRLRLLMMCTQPQQIKIFAAGTNKVAFVGPPGCGKSALLAKVAGNLVVKRHVKTTLVNMDDYKPSAAQDMDTCARVLKVPMCTGEEWSEPREAQDFQVVLADTRGIPIGAVDDLNQLGEKLESFGPDEIHLVLPAYVMWREINRWLDFFSPLHPTQVAVTFLDQTESFGLPFNLAAHKALKLSYFSWGRNKLAHLEEADMYRISNKLLENVEEFNVHLG